MRQIDYNLPPPHHLNREAAQALGLRWSEKDRAYVRKNGDIPAGSEGNNDTRWGAMSEIDAVHAHK